MDAVAVGFQEYREILRKLPTIADEKLLAELQQSKELTRELAALHDACHDRKCIPHVIAAILGCWRHAINIEQSEDAYEDTAKIYRARRDAAELLGTLFDAAAPMAAHAELFPNEVRLDLEQIIQAKKMFDWMRSWLAREGAARLKNLRENYPISRKRDPKKNFGVLLAGELTRITGDPRYPFVAFASDIVFPRGRDESTSPEAVRLARVRYLDALRERDKPHD